MNSVRPDCPPEAAARLANRRWCIRHSAWLLSVMLGFGVVTAVGFVYIAIRARRNAMWWIIAAAHLAGNIVVLTFSEIYETASGEMADWVVGLLFLVWGIGIVHGLALNGDWLRWRAGERRVPTVVHGTFAAAPLPAVDETGQRIDSRTFGGDPAPYQVTARPEHPQPPRTPIGMHPDQYQAATELLMRLVREFGEAVHRDSATTAALLGDRVGTEAARLRPQLNALVRAVDTGVPNALRHGTDPALLFEAVERAGAGREHAQWAVYAWAYALGLPIAPPATRGAQWTP